jgi:type II secretory pathway component PulF
MYPKLLLLAILMAALVYFVFVVPQLEGTGPVVPRN